MRRVTSKLARRDYWVTDQQHFAHTHQGLPILNREDVLLIQRNVDQLKSMGINDVLDRKMRGIPVERSIFEWIQFRRNTSLNRAKQEFFDMVKEVYGTKFGSKVEPSAQQGGSDGQDGIAGSGSLQQSVDQGSAERPVSPGQDLDQLEFPETVPQKPGSLS